MTRISGNRCQRIRSILGSVRVWAKATLNIAQRRAWNASASTDSVISSWQIVRAGSITSPRSVWSKALRLMLVSTTP